MLRPAVEHEGKLAGPDEPPRGVPPLLVLLVPPALEEGLRGIGIGIEIGNI